MGRRTFGGSLSLVLALGSCSSLGFGGADEERTLTTSLAPETAAFLVAQACRSEFPEADPLPLHPGAPAVRLGDDEYEVRYNRSNGQGYRLHTNGRLLAPAATAVRDGGQPMPLGPITFAPSVMTGQRAPGNDEIRVHVRGTGSGSEVTVQLYGVPASGCLGLHLERVFALAEAIESTAEMVEGGQWGLVRATVETALTGFGSGCCGRHEPLRAHLLVHLAAAEQALGHLDAARAATTRALDLAPFTPGLRLWQVRLGQRMAQDREVATDWHILAASPSRGTFCRVAAAELQESLERLMQQSPGSGYRQRASSLLRDDDLAGARMQLNLARSLDPLPGTDLHDLAEWYRRQGRHRAAFETGLQRLEISADPDLVLAMAELSARAGQSAPALHLLAKHWEELVARDRSAAEAWLSHHSRSIGPELATRMLTAEGSTPLAQEQLARWILSGRADPAAVDLLAMVWWLRQEAGDQGRDLDLPLRGNYESAPGVSPPR